MIVYKNMTRSELDAAYDNTNAVIGSAEILDGFNKRSFDVRRRHPRLMDMRYGKCERQKIDYFESGGRNAPVFIFIHGGYWQMRAKETFSFLAEGPLARGFDVALIGYTLAPQKNLGEIISEIRDAIEWIGNNNALAGNKEKMIISGWSAGGHLAAMCLNGEGVAAAISISGIFDLEPISLCYLNDKLKLDEADVRQLSPINLPHSNKPLIAICGSGELPELQNQTWTFAKKRAEQFKPGGAFTLQEHNHFTILEELASPRGKICNMLANLI